MRADVSPAQLKAFVTVARAGSFAAATEGFDRATRSNMLQLVRRLEQWMSVRQGHPVLLLEERSGHVTDEGRALLRAASDVVDAVDSFEGGLRDLARSARVLVGCYPAHIPLVADATAELKSRGHEVHVRLRDIGDDARRDEGRGLLQGLLSGRSDLVIVPASTAGMASDKVRTRPLYTARIVVVLAEEHRLRHDRGARIEDLRGEALFASPSHHASREMIDRALPSFKPRVESESVDALVAMGTSGMGAALVPSDSLPLRGLDVYPTLLIGGTDLTIDYVVIQRLTSASGSALDKMAEALESHDRPGS